MFAEQVVGLAERCGVSMAISLGALLADFPHSQPTQIIGTASDDELLDRFELRPSTYEGPTGIVGVLGDALSGGRRAHGLAVGHRARLRRPDPVAQGRARRSSRAACAMVGTTAPAGAFTRAVAEYEARVAALVAEDDDLADYVARLEAFVADDDDDDDDDDITAEAQRPPLGDDVDPDELYAEVERFLRDSGPGDPPHAE